MSGFNTSPRKDHVSVRLKAQNDFLNIKNAQAETKKLELESRKMEERLRELKVAMGKEKEEREKQGSGFWKRGQTGTLNSYATEILHKPGQKESKKRGVKLLKDEKIVLPHRSSEPGTMKYIADSYTRTKLKCGQCEERSASVSCVQCSEYFCAGCFSAFHYKGALKRHRTVPLQASGPRQCMSPRVSGPPSHRSSHGAEASAVSSIQYQDANRNSPIGASGSVVKSSLLSGQFDEDESAASFQDALKAWRNGGAEVTSPDDKRDAFTTSPQRPVSRVTTPIVKTETSTSTQETKQPIEIHFTNHGVSYADRLLLKKHRRTDVDHIITPGTISSNGTGEMVNEEEDLEPVDFQALYEAMVPSSTTPNSQHTVSSLSIIELDSTPKRKYRDVEQSNQYQVEEVSNITAWAIQNSIKSPTSPSTAASHQSPAPASVSPTSAHGKDNSPTRQRTESQKQTSNLKRDNSTLKTDSKRKTPKDHQEKSAKDHQEKSAKDHQEKSAKDHQEKSAKNHQEKSTRPPSRSKSSAGYRTHSARSRPASRAKSRAMFRMQVEGLLTKTPTPALQEIAQLADRDQAMETVSQYRSVLDDYFTGTDTSNNLRSPTPMLTGKKKDIRVSYALYQMAPRSWKPENSFSDMIPAEEAVVPELSDAIKAFLPGQMDTESPVVVNPFAGILDSRNHSEINTPSVAMGSRTNSEMNPFSKFMEGKINLNTGLGDTGSRANTDMSQSQRDQPNSRTNTDMSQSQRDQLGSRANTDMSQTQRDQLGSRTNSDTMMSRRDIVSRTNSDMKTPTRRMGSRTNSDLKGSRTELGSRTNSEISSSRRDATKSNVTSSWKDIGRRNSSSENSPDREFSTNSPKDMDPNRRHSLIDDEPLSPKWDRRSYREEENHEEIQCRRNKSNPRRQKIEEEFERELFSRTSNRLNTDMITPIRLDEISCKTETPLPQKDCIVIKGDDYSGYDDQTNNQTVDDEETLGQLEWELASESGRITADGKISRLSIKSNSRSNSSCSTVRNSLNSSVTDQGYDIHTRLREDELGESDDDDGMKTDRDDVRALH